MTDDKPEDLVEDFYQQQQLDAVTLQSIVNLEFAVRSENRWRRIAISAWLSVALGLVIGVGIWATASLYQLETTQVAKQGESIKKNIGSVSDIEDRLVNHPQTESLGSIVNSKPKQFHLIAFRSHSDHCPYCRETQQTFDQVVTLLDRDSIQCEMINLSDVNSESFQDRLISDLHLEKHYQGKSETAFLTLLDSEGSVQRKFLPSMSTPSIIEQILSIAEAPSQ